MSNLPHCESVHTHFLLYPFQFFGKDSAKQRFRDRAAVFQFHRVMQPLPDLGPRDFGRGRVFH